MIHASIVPETDTITLKIPAEYVGRKVEVLIYVGNEVELPSKKGLIAEFAGVLKLSEEQYIDFQKHLETTRRGE